jgi:hypothetical protein
MLCLRPTAALPLVLAGLALGCELQRPEDAYEPLRMDETDAGSTRESGPDPLDDVYGDASQVPVLDISKRDAGREPKADAGRTPDVVPDPQSDAAVDPGPDDPAPTSPLVGEYWMRTSAFASSTTSQPPVTVKTHTDTFLYSLVQVGFQGEVLKFIDWQCALRIDQRCDSGCSEVSTKLLDAAKSPKAFAPAKRDLTVAADGSWSASRAPYALGWRGDYGAMPNAVLPTSESDPLVYDPDGGRGKGVDVTSTLRTLTGLSSTCDMRVVQKIDVSYKGKLTDGKLSTGSLEDLGTEQNELATSCGNAKTTSSERMPGKVDLVPAPKPIGSEGATWMCPSLADFEAAFR